MNVQRTNISRRTQDVEFPCNTEIPPAIPDGEYELKFVRADESHQWNSNKVFLWFQMLTPGQWQGKEFYMACNARKDGKWGPSHKYMRAWILASGERPRRLGRMSTKVFRDKVFRAQMRTVTKDSYKRNLTPAQQYSVIGELLQRVGGAADVSSNSLIALVDPPPRVGIGEGEGTGVSEGLEEEEYEREWREEYEEAIGEDE